MATFDDRLARYASEFSNKARVSGDKPNYWDIPEGVTRVRILPGIDPTNPERDFFCKTMLHYSVSPSSPKIPVICGKTKNTADYCHVCDKITSLSATGSIADKAIADKMRPVYRYYIAMIPREGPKKDEIVIYPARKKILNDVVSLIRDPEYGDILDPITGRDVKLERSGVGRDTDYKALPSASASKVSSNPEETLANRPLLYRFAEAPDQAEVAAYMRGDVPYLKTGGMSLGWVPQSHVPVTFPDEVHESEGLTDDEVETLNALVQNAKPEPKVDAKATDSKAERKAKIRSILDEE